jgi:hypothetical protein
VDVDDAVPPGDQVGGLRPGDDFQRIAESMPKVFCSTDADFVSFPSRNAPVIMPRRRTIRLPK